MSSEARMTSERFFGGVDHRTDYLKSTLEFVTNSQPTSEELTDWILDNTPAGTESTVHRNISFLISIDLLDEGSDELRPTNKGSAFVQYDEPLVMYEGLEKAVDGFREILRAIAGGSRTDSEIQAELQRAFPNFVLPQGVVSKHLGWLKSLNLITESDGEYSIPIESGNFTINDRYSRWFIHDVFKGGRFSGISTPTDESMIFLFTGDSGTNYGYEDKFLDDDSFQYTGEGAEGDMTMEGGNASIRNHEENDEKIHLFEDTELPWIVTYLGEFKYADHWTRPLDDENNNEREAIQFRLVPAGGREIDIEEGTLGSLSGEELFRKAKQSSPTEPVSGGSSGGSGGGNSYRGSEVVREFALWAADGVCQGCEEDAPFLDKQGDPFLEVHHLTRRSDGGPDDPENVIAICPNCHRRVHNGRDKEEFNQELVEKAKHRNAKF